MPVLRLPLAESPEGRTASAEKDSLLINAYRETDPDGIEHVVKRAGLETAFSGGILGQGAGPNSAIIDNELSVFNGQMWAWGIGCYEVSGYNLNLYSYPTIIIKNQFIYVFGEETPDAWVAGTMSNLLLPEARWFSAFPTIGNGYLTCFYLTDDDKLYGWGATYNNELCQESFTASAVPVPILSDFSFQNFVSTPNNAACPPITNMGVLTDGRILGWGLRTIGADGAVLDPIYLYTNGLTVDSDWKSVHHATPALGIKNDGTLWALLGTEWGGLFKATPLIEGEWLDVIGGTSAFPSEGVYSWIGLKPDGTIWNIYRLPEDPLYPFTATQDTTINSVVSIALCEMSYSYDGYTFFAIKQDGTLWVRGGNKRGQAGVGSTDFVSEWTQILVGHRFTTLNSFTLDSPMCAITTEGFLFVWGSSAYDGYWADVGCPNLFGGSATILTSPTLIDIQGRWEYAVFTPSNFYGGHPAVYPLTEDDLPYDFQISPVGFLLKSKTSLYYFTE